jgi:hypothetical protein
VRLGGGTTEMVLLVLHCSQAGGRGRVVELSRRGGRSSRSRGRGGGRIRPGLLRPLPAGVLAIAVGGLPPGGGDEAGKGERVGRRHRCEAGRAASAGATHPSSGTAVAGSRGAAARPRPEAGRSLRGLSLRSAWGRGAQQSEQMEEGHSDFAGEGEKGCLSGRRRARLGGVRRPPTCGDREQGRRGRGMGREGGLQEVKKEKERV